MLLTLVAAEAAPTAAPAYELEPSGSSLKFLAVQQGAKFESHFETFAARVQFDPARPETGQILARIKLASVDTGNPERDEILKTVDWFGVSQWPEATFAADRIVRAADGYSASGTLTIRGVSGPVTLSFRWTSAAGGKPARLNGGAAVERLAFGVGQGDWQDTAYVGNAVAVQVDIRLRPVQGTVKSVTTKDTAQDAR
jgi:polyisoprenoid-binding protein YceI